MVEIRKFDTCDLGTVDEVILSKNGLCVSVISYGATIRKILFTDKNGVQHDVCLGYDTVGEYIEKSGYLGAIIGRNGNRIGGAAYTHNGVQYKLTANEGENQLHGGLTGLDKKIWNYQAEGDAVVFTSKLADGEDGFPGVVNVRVRYSIDENNGLCIDYEAVSDKDTVINLTNHCYFNLGGADGGTILDHTMQMDADRYTLTDAASIPTGELPAVDGTCMDFRVAKPIGRDIDGDIVAPYGGYDHNFCLVGEGLRKVLDVKSPKTGIRMEVITDQEGVQFYAGNFLDQTGKGGVYYAKHTGFCLETQHYPDAVNHENFPTSIVKAGDLYKQTTVYRFIAE